MKLFKPLQVIMLSMLTLFAGCVDEPTSVGSRLLPPTDFSKADSMTIGTVSSSSLAALPIEFTDDRIRIPIGKSGSTESWGLLLFGFVDTLKDVNVQQAELRMRVNYHFGDSLSSFSVVVRKALRNWFSSSFTFDSLQAAGTYEPTATPPQTFGGIGDTDDIAITLDTALVHAWLRNVGETESTNFGLVLEPTNTSVIKGFARALNNVDQGPTIRLLYTRTGSASVDTVRITASFDRFIARVTDTSFASDSTASFIRNGVAYRGKLDFDVSAVPAHAAILKATMEVTLDGARSSLNSYSVDSLFALFMTPNGFPEETPELRLPSALLSEPLTINGEKVYRFLVTEYVQSWVRGFPTRSIALAGYSEANSCDVFAIHGSASAITSLRPRIFVIYSTPQ